MGLPERIAAARARRERPDPVPRGRPRAGHAAIAFTVAVLGFLLATQLQVREGIGQRLAIEREEDLARILADLSARSDRLSEEIVELRIQLASAAGSAEQERVLLDNARRELDAIQILLGAVPVVGEGLVVVIEDPLGSVGADAIVDVLQELRDAGAEAIEVDGVRAVASTAISGRPRALRVGGRRVRAPYRVAAVGRRSTLAEALRIPGGVVDSIEAHAGAAIRIAVRERVAIASLQRIPTFTYARASERR